MSGAMLQGLGDLGDYYGIQHAVRAHLSLASIRLLVRALTADGSAPISLAY